MIALLDYGVGNLKSIENALRYHHKALQVETVNNADKIKNYSKIILPGVGAFGDAIRKVREKHFDEAIREEIIKGKYLLGICLGMQMLATKSFEYGEHEGLNLIEGEVKHFRDIITDLRVPHIGWNDVDFVREDVLLKNIENKSDFYFVHSYFFSCRDQAHVLGQTDYGVNFASIVKKDNIYGAQFHPEKSQEAGLKFMKNFVEL